MAPRTSRVLTSALACVALVTLCACTPDSASTTQPASRTTTNPNDSWLDMSVPRADLSEQDQLNRVGYAMLTLAGKGVGDSVLPKASASAALIAVCDSLDKGNSNATAIFDMAQAAPDATQFGAEVLAVAADQLCPEHAEAVLADGGL